MFYLLALLFASAPTYVIRFNIGAPVNLLQIISAGFLLVFAYWLKKNNLAKDFKNYVEDQPRLMILLAGIFLLAGLISALIAPDKGRGIGLFVALFLEPILIYLPASYILNNPENKIRMIKWIALVVGVISLYAIFQYFTTIGLPLAWQGNPVEPKRALGVFAHPNGLAMFLTPLLAFLMPFIFGNHLDWKYKSCYGLGVVALLLSLSRGGWIAFAATIAVYVVLFAKKRLQIYATVGAILMILIIYIVPFLNQRATSAIEGDRSTESRYSLWHTGNKMIASSPLLGKGLNGFEQNFSKYNTDPLQLPINLAHNIFINLWVETGLLGLISFVLILLFAIYRSARLGGLVATATTLFLIAFLVHGQVDNVYFKNDLALMFWMILAFQS